MTKKELMNLGITDEQADSVLEMLKDAYVPLTRFNEINEKMKTYRSERDDLKKENDELSTKVKDTEKLDEEIKTLKEANTKLENDHTSQIASMKKDNAIEASLRDSKAKNIKAVKALLDLSKITYEDDKLSGLEEQIKSLQESDNSKFMFDTADKYVPNGTQPGQASGGGTTGGSVSFGDAIKNYFTSKN